MARRLRIFVQAAGEVYGQAASAGGDSWRTGRAIAADVPGAQQLLLNELGIALIYPNVRGSTGYGRRFRCWTMDSSARTRTRTSNALFDWIGARPDLDAEHIAVTGGSMADT